jgi:RsiW-degrading membrane proteinase PrsW (M82 family)
MTLLLALVLGFTPGLLWLAFFLREDAHPEPKKMIARVFVVGGLSAFIALVLEYFASDFLKGFAITAGGFFSFNITPFIGFAIIEEVIKFIFVWKMIHRSPYFDEPIDAMIYMVTGALGFATAENFFLVLSNSTGDVFSVILLRFIGATLLHALSSAFIGYMWAWGLKKKMTAVYVAWGLIFASIFHAVFNLLVYRYNTLLIYPTVFLAAIGFVILYDFEKLRKIEEKDEKLISKP